MKKGGKLYCHGHSITNNIRISDSDSNLHFLFDSVNSINWPPAETFANLEHQDRNLFIQVVVELYSAGSAGSLQSILENVVLINC